VLELGAGCGVISIALAAMHQPREVIAVELQPELHMLITRNAELNAIATLRAVTSDLRNLPDAHVARESFDAVVANPPYRASNAGRISPNAARHVARSEASATLEDFIAAASRCLRPGGRAALVFVADRTAELIAMLREHRLEPKRIRFVHPYAGAPASTILLEARKHGGIEAAIEPPLILFEAPGVYTKEARAVLDEIASRAPEK